MHTDATKLFIARLKLVTKPSICIVCCLNKSVWAGKVMQAAIFLCYGRNKATLVPVFPLKIYRCADTIFISAQ